MKKILILILILSAVIFADWSDYKEVSWNALIKNIDFVDEETKATPGETIWKEQYKLSLALEKYPEITTDPSIKNGIANYIKILGLKNVFVAGYVLPVEKNGRKFILIFQDVLIPYLKDEVKLGEEFNLLVVFGSFNSFDKTTLLFVNEFESAKSRVYDGLFKKGVKLMDEKKYSEAIAEFDKALEIDDDSLNIFYNKGMCYLKLENYTEALKYFDVLIKENSQDGEAYYQSGICYKNLNQIDKAIEFFSQAIKIADKETGPLFQRANCYFNQKEYTDSIEDYKKIIALEPESEGICQFAIACCLAMQGDKSKAIECLLLAKKAGYINKERYTNSKYLISLKEMKEFKNLINTL